MLQTAHVMVACTMMSVQVWSLGDCRCLRSVSAHVKPVRQLAIQEGLLYSTACQKTRVWDLSDMACLRVLQAPRRTGHQWVRTGFVCLSYGCGAWRLQIRVHAPPNVKACLLQQSRPVARHVHPCNASTVSTRLHTGPRDWTRWQRLHSRAGHAHQALWTAL